MFIQIKLRKVGNSVGTVLPKEVLARLNLEAGDTLYLTETPDGFRVTSADPDFHKLMKAANKTLKRYRNTLAELAK